MIWSAEGTTFDFSPYAGCTGGMLWDPAVDPITLTIVSGSDLGEFTVGDDPAPHTTVTVLASELPTVRFIPSGHLRPYGVNIEARCLSIVKTVHLDVRYCSILLGETKYFYAVWVEDDPWLETPYLRICETDSPVLPAGAEASDVWVNREPVYDPVCRCIQPGPPLPPVLNMEYGENAGSRLGVYWEKNKPVPGGTGDLPVGMIRLVGRYWHADSVYMVNLIALKLVSYAGGERPFGSSVPIEVKKPDVLGEPDLTNLARHSIVKDVTNGDLDLDALVIKYAGENGIPPQVIKGQIEKETTFKPAWRYEPFRDLEWQRNNYEKYFASDLPFNVHEGVPNDLPASHTNVSPTPYVKNPAKISDFAIQHWFDRYVQRGTGDKPDVILGSDKLTEFWSWVYWSSSFCMELSRIPVGIPELKRYAHDFVQASILDGSYKKEDFSRIAQTRKVTSYGYVQMLYITAVDFSWRETEDRYGTLGQAYVDKRDVTQYPEELNEQDFLFPRYSDFTLFDLRVAITEAASGKRIKPKDRHSTRLLETIPEGNWPTGFDEVWARAMQWHNPGEGRYGQDVMRQANNYLPAYKK